MSRNLAEVSFLFPVPDKISMQSLLNSKKIIDLNHATMKEQKLQDENKNTAHHAERYIKTKLVLVLESQNPPKPTGSMQLAKSIHTTSNNIV